jgi:hypothetical protein
MNSTVVIERLAKDLNLSPSEAAGALSGIGEVICKGASTEQARGTSSALAFGAQRCLPRFDA